MGSLSSSSTLCRHSSAGHSSPIPDITLTSHIQSLFNASVAVNTRQTHTAGINSFETFRQSPNLPSLWPPLDTHITRFIAYLSLSGYKYSTAQSYIAAISFYSKAIYNVDSTNHFIIRKLLQGMQRTTLHKDTRLPITLQLLNKIIPTLQTVCNTIYETKLFTAAFTLAFHALLRIGEFTVSKGNTPATIIQFHDITMQQTNIQLTICHSKTDQLGVGANLQIPASNGVACPFAAMHAYLHMRTSQTGPLFIHFEGQPLTRYQFITILKRCLNAIGVDSSNYNSHSFRIGAATTLAIQGVHSDVIQGSGRWRSNAFRTYIR